MTTPESRNPGSLELKKPLKKEVKEKRNWKDFFLNKWTALITLLGTVTAVGIHELGYKDKLDGDDNGEQSLQLRAEDLPESPAELQEAIDAIDELTEVVNAKRIREAYQDDARKIAALKNDIDSADDTNSEAVGEETDEEEVEQPAPDYSKLGIGGTGTVVLDTDKVTIVEHPHSNGSATYERIDKTLPDEETATDKSFKEVSDGFARNLPGYNIERTDQWHYKVTLKEQDSELPPFLISVRVMGDGRYLVGSASGMENEAYVNNLEEMYKMIELKLKILKMSMEVVDDASEEAFVQFLESVGLLPQ